MLSESEVKRLFFSCIFMFIIQIALIFSYLVTNLDQDKENDNDNDPNKIDEI